MNGRVVAQESSMTVYLRFQLSSLIAPTAIRGHDDDLRRTMTTTTPPGPPIGADASHVSVRKTTAYFLQVCLAQSSGFRASKMEQTSAQVGKGP